MTRYGEVFVNSSLPQISCLHIDIRSLPSWRRMRRAGHEALNEMTHNSEFYPTQAKEAVLLADGLLNNPHGWESEFSRWVRFTIRNHQWQCRLRVTASAILSIVYDIPTVLSVNNPTITNVNRFMEHSADYGNPGNYLVEYFPWMLYFPSWLAKWKREAIGQCKFFSALFEGMFHDVENRMARFCFSFSISPRLSFTLDIESRGWTP